MDQVVQNGLKSRVRPFTVRAVVIQSELGVRNSTLASDWRLDDKYIPRSDFEPSSCGLDNICRFMPIVKSESVNKIQRTADFKDAILEEDALEEDQKSQPPFVRKKTVKAPKKVKTYMPYEVENWAVAPSQEKTSFGINVDDFIDLQRKKEERLLQKRIKTVKAVSIGPVEAQITFNQKLEQNKEEVPPTVIITNQKLITVKANELDRIFEAENKLQPKSTIKPGTVVKRDTIIQKAVKKALRGKLRLYIPQEQKDLVEQVEVSHIIGANSSQAEENKGESDDGTVSERSLEFEREQAVKELEEIFGECGTKQIETRLAKKTFKTSNSNSIKNLYNMDIIKAIEPNLGVNILEEDSDEENQAEKSSIKDESIFSNNRARFKVVKQGEPYQPQEPDRIKMSRSHYSSINQVRNFPSKTIAEQNVSNNSKTLKNHSIKVEDSLTKDSLLVNQRTESQNFSTKRRSVDTIIKTKNAKQVYLKEAQARHELNSTTMSYRPTLSVLAEPNSQQRQSPLAFTGRQFAQRTWSVTPDMETYNINNLGPILAKRTSRDFFEQKKHSVQPFLFAANKTSQVFQGLENPIISHRQKLLNQRAEAAKSIMTHKSPKQLSDFNKLPALLTGRETQQNSFTTVSIRNA